MRALEDAPDTYWTFRGRTHGCVEVVDRALHARPTPSDGAAS